MLKKDGAYADRMVAAAILANFAERDSTWFALVDALRDPSDPVRTASAAVLGSFPSRPVDWASQTATLRFLLGGTNVAASELVFSMLARTQISPTLATALLIGKRILGINALNGVVSRRCRISPKPFGSAAWS